MGGLKSDPSFFEISKAIPRLLPQAVGCPEVTGTRWCGGLHLSACVGACMCSGVFSVQVDSHTNSSFALFWSISRDNNVWFPF